MSQAAALPQGHAETLKLARLLGREPEQLAYLERLSSADIRQLREQVTEALYDTESGSLRKLAAASRLLPTGLTATISERAFGPLLSARLAGMLDPDRAIEVASKLPPRFLADVAIELDPRRASELISGIRPDLIGQITAELVGRGEYVTMGRFVGHLHEEAVVAAIGAMGDHAVLQVAFVLEDKAQLGRLVDKLTPPRIAGVIGAAADDGLWVQALDLLNHLSARQRKAMVAAALALDGDGVAAILDAIVEHDLWAEATLIAEHDETLQVKLAERLRALPAPRRRQVAERARESGALERLGLVDQAPAGT
jgi:hypothetical protein